MATQNTVAAAATGFNANTRQSFVIGAPIAFSSAQPVQQLSPPVGFLARLYLNITLTLTTGAAGTYTILTTDPPSPYGIIQRLNVQTNIGQMIVDMSGYGCYLLQRTLTSSGLDPRNPITTFQNSNSSAAVYAVPATMTTSTAYTFQFVLEVPIAWTESNKYGLLPLQNPANRVTVQVTWGQYGNMIGGTGVPTSLVGQAVPTFVVFNVPQNPQNYPDLSYAHVMLEDQFPITANGIVNYYAPPGPAYLKVIQKFVNNGTFMVPANFSQLQISYQNTQTPYTIPPTAQLQLQFDRYGAHLPDGVFVHDFGYSMGLPELPGTRDIINTAKLTSFQFLTTIGAAITQPAYITSVKEELMPMAVG